MNSQSDVLNDNDFLMHSASQDMQCEVLGLEAGNEFAVAFDGRISLLQSQSCNVSMIHIDEGISVGEEHDNVFGGPSRAPINGQLTSDQITTACLQNASNTSANNESIFIERIHSNIVSFPHEIGRLLEGTLRNIEERGAGLAARLSCIERKMEDLQNAVSAGLLDICSDIRDTEGLLQLDAFQIQQIRRMCTNVYTTGQPNSRALRNSKSTIRLNGIVPVISPLPLNEEAGVFPGPVVPETAMATPK